MNTYLKTTFYVIGLGLLVFTSCKTDKTRSYKAYYQTINSEYAKIRAAQANNVEMGDLDIDDDFVRNDIADLEKELAEAQAKAQAYKDAYERIASSGGGGASSTTQAEQEPEEYANEKYFREEKVREVPEYGGKLYRYSVVVASLRQESGVRRLKKSFASSTNEDVVVAQNDDGMYRFILGSYESRGAAIQRRNEVMANYAESHSYLDLMRRFGIPFSDTWILIKKQ